MNKSGGKLSRSDVFSTKVILLMNSSATSTFNFCNSFSSWAVDNSSYTENIDEMNRIFNRKWIIYVRLSNKTKIESQNTFCAMYGMVRNCSWKKNYWPFKNAHDEIYCSSIMNGFRLLHTFTASTFFVYSNSTASKQIQIRILIINYSIFFVFIY